MCSHQILNSAVRKMNCGGGGNKFSCGLRRFDQHKMGNDRPANQQLHDENQKRLNELLRLREEQDKGIFQTTAQSSELDKFYKTMDLTGQTTQK